jgi:hypothetical protein
MLDRWQKLWYDKDKVCLRQSVVIEVKMSDSILFSNAMTMSGAMVMCHGYLALERR